jgi:kynureninase
MTQPDFQADIDFSREMDAADELASFRERFVIADPDMIYADGNSLGRLPREASERMQSAVNQEWGDRLIRGWNEGWFEASSRVGDKIAQLIGAGPGEVIVSDTTSINLFKLVMAAMDLRPERTRIVSDDLNFPSDLYVIQGCIRLLEDRHSLHLVPSDDGIIVDSKALYNAISDDTALVTLSHVVFKSAFLYDAEEITRRAHDAGALVLWDLGHSAGVVPAQLDEWGVDFAVGCTYKYLNGGPGAPGFLFVRQDLQEKILSPLWGWFGQKAPFAFNLDYEPVEGIKRFLASSPPILSLSAMEAAVDIVREAGIDRIRHKSIQLTSYLVFLFDSILAPLGFKLGSPREAEQRGSHVSVQHPEGYRINRALIEEMNVLPDFREPDNLRLGVSPLYTSFMDVWQMVDRIRWVVDEKRFLNYSENRLPVT